MGKEKKLRVAFFISDSGVRDRQRLYEFQAEALSDHIQHYFILSGNKHFKSFLKSKNIGYTDMSYHPRSIWSILKFAHQMRKELKEWDIVHTHYHDANLLGLMASKYAGVPVRIYTRHHNTYYHDVSSKKAILINRLFNRLATSIIAPSESVAKTLVKLEKVNVAKVYVVHHPFECEEPSKLSKISERYDLNTDGPVIGSIATFQPLKGIKYIIEGFEKVMEMHPSATLIMANAHGSHQKEYTQLAMAKLGDRVKFIEYENDINALYELFDLFIHVPVSVSSESFGQVYIESMAFGIPGVFTNSGVLPEMGEDGKNCLIVPYRDSSSIAEAIERYLSDSELCEDISNGAKLTSAKYFSLSAYREKLLSMYFNQ
jgi:glycosyltransferase involved in cell wall biosynthesis